MSASWNVLVVDDEEDVHAVTRLAFKRKQWRGRDFSVTSANSAKEARKILEGSPRSTFHVALVDVVMESEKAGLDLCDYIRAKHPLSLRVILRTGQPGAAPEERVLEDFEIDHYLSKVEATADRIFGLVRACLRTSLDVAVVTALAAQLRELTTAFEGGKGGAKLDDGLRNGLASLEAKYQVAISFYPVLEAIEPGGPNADHITALLKAHDSGMPLGVLASGPMVGLGASCLFLIDAIAEPPAAGGLWSKVKHALGSSSESGPVRFGYVVDLPKHVLGSTKLRQAFGRDLAPFNDNWKAARRILAQDQMSLLRSTQSS